MSTRRAVYCTLAFAAVLFAGCAGRCPTPAVPASGDVQHEVRAVLDAQVAAWNRGDVRTFMQGYEASDAVVFTSGGRVRRGYEATLARYLASYPDRATMGTLGFESIEITPLGRDAALAFGRFVLAREGRPGASGVFSLVLRRGANGLRIVHDHTSADPPALVAHDAGAD